MITNPLLLPSLQESGKLHDNNGNDTTHDTTTTTNALAIHRDNDITSSKSGSRHQCNDEDNERIPSREEVAYGKMAYQRRMEELLDEKRKRNRSNNHDIMDLSSMNDNNYYNIANKYNKRRRVLPRGDDKHSSANHRYERQHGNIVDDEYNNPEDNYYTTTNHGTYLLYTKVLLHRR